MNHFNNKNFKSPYLKKLGSDKTYKKPIITYQQQLTSDEIKKKLDGYKQVDDIKEVPLNTHVRYFKLDDEGNHEFKLGGFLHNKENADKYVILSNGTYTWSVNTDGTVFFKKMTHTEEVNDLKMYYEDMIQLKDKEIKKLKLKIKELLDKQ
jgi:hypothetical protein